MAARYFIVVGDPTTGGGQAVEGYSGWKVECLDGSSRGVVRVGDQVLCDQCGPTTATEGYPFALIPDSLLAYDNSKLACGHRLISKMQRLFSWDDPEPRTARTSAPLRSETRLVNDSRYSVQFVVRSATGEPIPNFEYVLIDSTGNEVEGTTDECGQTARHFTSVFTRFSLYPREAPDASAAAPDTCLEC